MDTNETILQPPLASPAVVLDVGAPTKHRVKPKYRGIPDLFATIIIVPAAALMMAMAEPGVATTAATIYTLSLAFLFAMSTTYHVPHWPKNVRAWLRRGDHSAIYVLIAGSYTPPCLLLLGETGNTMLAIVWGAAVVGFLKSMFWANAPRNLNTIFYLLIGWSVSPNVLDLWRAGGPLFFGLLFGGGMLYSVGAVIYAKKWFNSHSHVFGYHEVFHIFVIAAAASHFAGMWLILV